MMQICFRPGLLYKCLVLQKIIIISCSCSGRPVKWTIYLCIVWCCCAAA